MGKWTEAQRAKFMTTIEKKYGTKYNKEGKKVLMGKLAKQIARKAKQSKKTIKDKDTSLVINGWKIILGKHEVRIEHE